MKLLGGITWEDDMQQVLIEKVNGGRVVSLPCVHTNLNRLIQQSNSLFTSFVFVVCLIVVICPMRGLKLCVG